MHRSFTAPGVPEVGQTLAEIATENNSTTIFPVPVDMLKAFMSSLDKRGASVT